MPYRAVAINVKGFCPKLFHMGVITGKLETAFISANKSITNRMMIQPGNGCSEQLKQ